MASSNFVNDHKVSIETLKKLHSMGFKLVPLALMADGTQRPSWTNAAEIYENPTFWGNGKHSLEAEAYRFNDVGTYLGESHLRDAEGNALYLHGLDCENASEDM